MPDALWEIYCSRRDACERGFMRCDVMLSPTHLLTFRRIVLYSILSADICRYVSHDTRTRAIIGYPSEHSDVGI